MHVQSVTYTLNGDIFDQTKYIKYVLSKSYMDFFHKSVSVWHHRASVTEQQVYRKG